MEVQNSPEENNGWEVATACSVDLHPIFTIDPSDSPDYVDIDREAAEASLRKMSPEGAERVLLEAVPDGSIYSSYYDFEGAGMAFKHKELPRKRGSERSNSHDFYAKVCVGAKQTPASGGDGLFFQESTAKDTATIQEVTIHELRHLTDFNTPIETKHLNMHKRLQLMVQIRLCAVTGAGAYLGLLLDREVLPGDSEPHSPPVSLVRWLFMRVLKQIMW